MEIILTDQEKQGLRTLLLHAGEVVQRERLEADRRVTAYIEHTSAGSLLLNFSERSEPIHLGTVVIEVRYNYADGIPSYEPRGLAHASRDLRDVLVSVRRGMGLDGQTVCELTLK
jgi:hypothetical protein